jgi:hypothetical protein
MLTYQEKAASTINYKELLPEKKQFEDSLQTKSDLHTITFQTLWIHLTQLKNHEIEHKKPIPVSEYEVNGAQRALDLSPKILAVENLLLASKVELTKEAMREKLISLFLTHQSNEDLKKALQLYYTGIKADKTAVDAQLDAYKLNAAITTSSSVGIIFGTYSHADKDFFQKLATIFHNLSRMEIADSEINQKISDYKHRIEKLHTEIRAVTLSDPITQLDKLFNTSVNKLKTATDSEAKKINFNLDPIIRSLKAVAKQYTDEYQQKVNVIIDRITDYPNNQKEVVEKKLRKASDIEHEKNHIKSKLRILREKQAKDLEQLRIQFNKELKNDTDSKKQAFTKYIKKTESIIQTDNIPDTTQFEEEVNALEQKSDGPEKIFATTCRKPIIYSEKINKLITEITGFENEGISSYEKIFKELLSEYKKSYPILITAVKNLGLANKNTSLLEPTFNNYIEDILTIKIPQEENLLTQNIIFRSEDATKQLDASLKTLKASLHEKSSQVRELLGGCLEAETKSAKTANDAWENALKKLPLVFKRKATEYKSQFNKLSEAAKKDLSMQNKAIFATQIQPILTEYDDKIKKNLTDLSDKKLIQQLEEEREDAFLNSITKKINNERFEQNKKAADQAKSTLDTAIEREQDALDEQSEQNPSAAEKARILAEKEIKKLNDELTKHKLKNYEYVSTTYSRKSIVLGAITGAVSLLIAPIAWAYGIYQTGKEIYKKTASLFYSVLASFAAFVVMPFGWIFGGIKLAQRSIALSAPMSPEEIPLLSITPTSKTRIKSIKLPEIPFKEKFQTVCSNKFIPINHVNKQIIIGTEPRELRIDKNNNMYINKGDYNIKLSNPAIQLILRIFSVLNKADDLRVEIENGFILAEITIGSKINKFYISPGNGDDKNLVYVNEKRGSYNKIPLLPEQFNPDEVLKKTLYQSSTPMPSKVSTTPSSGDNSFPDAYASKAFTFKS